MKILVGGRKCDLCDHPSKHIRFAAVFPGEDFRGMKRLEGQDALVGFLVLCGSCTSKSRDEQKAGMLDAFAKVFPDGCEGYYRPVVLGLRVGEAVNIPARRSLEVCSDCKETIWISQDEADEITCDKPMFLCKECASERSKKEELDCVPTCLVE